MQVVFLQGVVLEGFLRPVPPFPESFWGTGKGSVDPSVLLCAAANRVAAILAPELGSGGQSHGAAANPRLLHTRKSCPRPECHLQAAPTAVDFFFFLIDALVPKKIGKFGVVCKTWQGEIGS